MTLEALTTKYARLARTAPGVSRVGWLDELQQQVQFEVMLDLTLSSGDSVLDVGCGVGDLLALLDERGFAGRYTGVDLLPAFIDEAQTQFANRPDAQFIVGDVSRLSLASHDFVFASGLFDYAESVEEEERRDTPQSPQPAARYAAENSLSRWEETILRLAGLARKALVWNGYSQLPPGRADMWAVDASRAAALCQRLSPFWQLRADYAPGHYTAFIFKRDYWLTPTLQTLIGRLFLDRALLDDLKSNPQTIARDYGLTMQQLNLLEPLQR